MASLSGEPGEGCSEQGAVDPETAAARIRERGERVAARETERALAQLRARGHLSAREEKAVEALAERLTDRLLAVPEAGLREADGETTRVALALFAD